MEIMRSYQDYAGPSWDPDSTEQGEATILGDEGFLQMFGDHRSTGDLFELVWQGGGSNMDQVHHCVPLSLEPPSEEEMAEWLYPIVRGEVEPVTSMDQPACGDIVDGTAEDGQLVLASMNTTLKAGVNCTESNGRDSSVKRKPDAGGRRSHHSETHNLAEKRRRCKINEKFKTLQQLVPGCDKGNKACILDHTIRYMKSLQQQIQAMAIGRGMSSATAVAYPVVQSSYPALSSATIGLPSPPQAAIAPGMLVRGLIPPPTGGALAPRMVPMTPFVPMLPLVHRPAVMVPAAPMLQYPKNVVPNAASPPARNRG